MLQRERERRVTTDAVAEHATTLEVDRKVVFDGLPQFAEEIRLHPEMPGVRQLRRVDVVRERCAEIPVVLSRFEVDLARTDVGGDEHEPELRCKALRAGFTSERVLVRFLGAEVKQNRRTGLEVRWQEDAEFHWRLARYGRVPVETLHAAEAEVFGENFERHDPRDSMPVPSCARRNCTAAAASVRAA